MEKNKLRQLLSNDLSFWSKLNDDDKRVVEEHIIVKSCEKGEIIVSGGAQCLGLVVVSVGQIRAFVVSDEGKEITLYRLLENDVCIMSASCMLKDLNFEICLVAEEKTEIVVVPTKIFEELSEKNIEIKNFTLALVSSRFSDVVWTLQQFVFLGTAKRLANALLEQSTLRGGVDKIEITHDELAREVGTAREVVSRLLKQFESDKMVSLARNKIEILNFDALSNV